MLLRDSTLLLTDDHAQVFKMAWERVELQGANKRATVANRDALKLAAEMVCWDSER